MGDYYSSIFSYLRIEFLPCSREPCASRNETQAFLTHAKMQLIYLDANVIMEEFGENAVGHYLNTNHYTEVELSKERQTNVFVSPGKFVREESLL